MRLYTLDLEDLKKLAQKRVTRELTALERQMYLRKRSHPPMPNGASGATSTQ